MLNLILAIFWLCLGVGIFLYQGQLPPDDRRAALLLVQLPGFPPFSAGWVALVLAVYNVFRWWLRRAYRSQLQSVHDAEADWKRRRRAILRQQSNPDEYHPELDFRSPPAPETPKEEERGNPAP